MATVVRPRYATTAEAAAYIRRSPGTLKNWRSQGRGPKYHKTGDTPQAEALYDYADLDAWVIGDP